MHSDVLCLVHPLAFFTALLCVAVCSDAQTWPLSGADPSYSETISAPSQMSLSVTSARLVLLKTGQPVKVANRLIVVATHELTDFIHTRNDGSSSSWSELMHYPDHYLYLVQYPFVSDALNAMSAFNARADIAYVQPDILPLRPSRQRLESWPLATTFNENTFNLFDYLPLDALWQQSRGRGQRIALIDIGFDTDHRALEKMPVLFSWDVDRNTEGVTVDNPQELHGSYVAGVIWSRPELIDPDIKPGQPGVAWGIAPEAELIALQLHRPWTSNLLKTFYLAEQHQADIINISWLIPWVADPVRQYLKYLVTDANEQRGILVVAAADPQFRANIGLAAIPELLVVTSVDHQGLLAGSSWDQTVDLAAVSYIQTVSYREHKTFERFLKTSASVPVVSGLAALFRAIRPELSATDIEQILGSSADKKALTLASGETIEYRSLNAQLAYRQLLDSNPLENKTAVDSSRR